MNTGKWITKWASIQPKKCAVVFEGKSFTYEELTAFYLKEVIRRFPHTTISQQAYQALEESVHFGYSGSGGDTTPPSMVRMLKEYKGLSDPIAK